MPWPPASSSRRVALVIYGLALLVYITLSGLLALAGLDPRATVVVAQFLGLLGLSLWLTQMLKIPVREAFALRPAEPIHWYMTLGAAIPLQAAGGAMQFAIANQFPEDSRTLRMMEELIQQFAATETGFDLLMLVLAAVVTAAICEEFLFRGLLLNLLQHRSGWISAIIGSAALFALFHLNPIVLLPAGLVGAYLGVLVCRSSSLYPAILAHGLNNSIALFGLPLIFDEATYAQYLWVIMVVSTATFAIIFFAYLRVTEATMPEEWQEGLKSIRVDGELGNGHHPKYPDQAQQ